MTISSKLKELETFIKKNPSGSFIEVNNNSIQLAKNLIEYLDDWDYDYFRDYTFGIDPDGSITMEWYISTTRLLSISLGENVIHYAGLFGTETVSGVIPYKNTFPSTLVYFIEKL